MSSSSYSGNQAFSSTKDRIIRMVLWTLLVISSTVVFGRASEQCGLLPVLCPSRFAWVIACGVISAFIGLSLISLNFCHINWFAYAEASIAVFLVLWWAAGAGVAANFRTGGISSLVVTFVSKLSTAFKLQDHDNTVEVSDIPFCASFSVFCIPFSLSHTCSYISDTHYALLREDAADTEETVTDDNLSRPRFSLWCLVHLQGIYCCLSLNWEKFTPPVSRTSMPLTRGSQNSNMYRTNDANRNIRGEELVPAGQSYLRGSRVDSKEVRSAGRGKRIATTRVERSDSDSHSDSTSDYDVDPGRGDGRRSTLNAENLASCSEKEYGKIVLRDDIV